MDTVETESKKTELTPDARAALRAYVQRCEVRLSTMHRVAGVFLNGAGILILLPVLFRDVVKEIVAVLVTNGTALYAVNNPKWGLYLLLAIPFMCSIYVPLRSLYLLLKDLVDFYFVGHSPGYEEDLFSPRFALTAIAFSPDESQLAKDIIVQTEYNSLYSFVLPFGESQAQYFDNVRSEAGKLIDPPTRTPEYLKTLGIPDPNERISTTRANRFNVALGLAGLYDRDLAEEAAKTEVSLVRHALSLRRLVLRYAKALLAVVWTTLVSFSLVALTVLAEPIYVMSIAYLIWGVAMRSVMRLPVNWIFETANKNARKISARDSQLLKFEEEVAWISLGAALISVVVFVISVITA
jgi:hypothetical protein